MPERKYESKRRKEEKSMVLEGTYEAVVQEHS